MINLPGNKGHHYLKSDPRHFKILVNKFYEACVYHDFSELKWILSPDRRTKIKNFIDMRDESILKEDSLYHHVFLLFNDFEAMKKTYRQDFQLSATTNRYAFGLQNRRVHENTGRKINL